MGKKGKKGKFYYHSSTGGYGYLTNAQLQNIALPKKIKCDCCKKSKSPEAYSQAALAEVRSIIDEQGRDNAKYDVRCMQCVGGPRNELECIDCNEWKGLDSFAKVHRKTPDSAVCKSCMDENGEFNPRQIEEPGVGSDSGSESDGQHSDDSGDTSDNDDNVSQITSTNNGASSVNSSLNKLSISETNTGSVGSSRLTSSLFSSLSTIGRGSNGGVAVNGSHASTADKSYGVPRSRTAVSAVASSNDTRKFANISPHAPQGTDFNKASTVRNGKDQSDDEDFVNYDSDSESDSCNAECDDEDDDDDDDDEDDDPYNGGWRDGNAIGN